MSRPGKAYRSLDDLPRRTGFAVVVQGPWWGDPEIYWHRLRSRAGARVERCRGAYLVPLKNGGGQAASALGT